jgi:hypothetical protein
MGDAPQGREDRVGLDASGGEAGERRANQVVIISRPGEAQREPEVVLAER